jgi:hypothetical protein
MKITVVTAVLAGAVLATAGCAKGSTTAHQATLNAPATPTPAPSTSHRPPHTTPVAHDTDTPSIPFACPKPAPPSPHFTTPQAAMRYLTTAWNRNDYVALCHVTTADARGQLNGMHTEAINLRLNHCTRQPAGDYQCYFDHDFPASRHKTGLGHSNFLVGPARTPGWYMTYFESCD